MNIVPTLKERMYREAIKMIGEPPHMGFKFAYDHCGEIIGCVGSASFKFNPLDRSGALTVWNSAQGACQVSIKPCLNS
jgi:hypothetical protein